jgi:hypothetical protein
VVKQPTPELAQCVTIPRLLQENSRKTHCACLSGVCGVSWNIAGRRGDRGEEGEQRAVDGKTVNEGNRWGKLFTVYVQREGRRTTFDGERASRD